MNEKDKNKLEINDASPEAVKVMLDYMYTGTVPTNISNIVVDLLHLADKYGLGSLKKACERCLMEDLCAENAVNTMIYADRCGEGYLRLLARFFKIEMFR